MRVRWLTPTLALAAALGLIAAAQPTPAPVPAAALAPESAGEDNSAALQRLVDAVPLDQPAVIRLDRPGVYRFRNPVKVPSTKAVVIDGGGVGRVDAGGRPWLVLTDGGEQWGRGRFQLRGFHMIAGRVVTEGDSVQLNRPVIADCTFAVRGQYAVELHTGYSVAPHVSGCWFQGGGLRWKYSRKNGEGVPHASSGGVFERLRVHADYWHRPGPDLHFEGHQLATYRNLICEGATAGWAAGVDPDSPDVRMTVGLLVDGPGPQGGSVEAFWAEHWNWSFVPGAGPGTPFPGYAVRLHNPYGPSAGAYQSGPFRLTDVSARGRVGVTARADAADTAVVRCWNAGDVVAEGPVVLCLTQTGGLARRAQDARLPQWKWD